MGIAGFIYDKLKAKGRDTRTRPPEGMDCTVDHRRYNAWGDLHPEGEFGYPEYPFVTDISGGSCTLKHLGKPSAAEVERQKAFMGIEDEPTTPAAIFTLMDSSGTLPFFDFPSKTMAPLQILEPIAPPKELTPMEHLEAALESAKSEDVGSALGHVAGAVASVDPATLGLVGATLVGAVLLARGGK